MALYEWLQMQQPDFYLNRIFNLLPRWMCQAARGLCWKIVIPWWEKGTFNLVVTSDFNLMVWGTLLVEYFCNDVIIHLHLVRHGKSKQQPSNSSGSSCRQRPRWSPCSSQTRRIQTRRTIRRFSSCSWTECVIGILGNWFLWSVSYLWIMSNYIQRNLYFMCLESIFSLILRIFFLSCQNFIRTTLNMHLYWGSFCRPSP